MTAINRSRSAWSAAALSMGMVLAVGACSGDDEPEEDDAISVMTDNTLETVTEHFDDPDEYLDVEDYGFTVWQTDAGSYQVSYAVLLTNEHPTHAVAQLQLGVDWVTENGDLLESPLDAHELVWVAPGGQSVLANTIVVDAEPADFNLRFPDTSEPVEVQKLSNRWIEYDAIDGDGDMSVTDADISAGAELEADVTVESSLPWDLTNVQLVAVWLEGDDIVGGSDYDQNVADISPGEHDVTFVEDRDGIPPNIDVNRTQFYVQPASFTTGVDLQLVAGAEPE